MANNYYEGTGVLVLERVTPVIKALFGAFALNEGHPGNGQAYIAQIAETNDPRWTDVLDGLEDLAAQLGIPMPDDEELSIPPLLERLAAHFGAEQDAELENLIERAVIISPGTRLRLDLPNDNGNDAPSRPPVEQEMRIFTQGEQRRQMRENLIAALTACAGRISGKDGAARLLELKPTTLRSRLESFAIDPRDYRPGRSQPRRYETNQTPR